MARRNLKRLFTDQQLIELYEQGFNDREIAEKLGTTQKKVGYHRRRLGLRAGAHLLLNTCISYMFTAFSTLYTMVSAP